MGVFQKKLYLFLSWWGPGYGWEKSINILRLEIRGFGIPGKKTMWPFRGFRGCCQMSFPLKQKLCSRLDNYHWAVPSPEILLSQAASQGVEIYIYNHLSPKKKLGFRTKLHTHNLGVRSGSVLRQDPPISTKKNQVTEIQLFFLSH